MTPTSFIDINYTLPPSVSFAMLGNLGNLSGFPVMCIRGQSLEYLVAVEGTLLGKAHFARAAAPTTAALEQETHPPLYCFSQSVVEDFSPQSLRAVEVKICETLIKS